MGKVIATIKLTNLKDAFLKEAGARRGRSRVVEVEALLDIGATRLYLKPSVIKKLGLGRTGTVLATNLPLTRRSGTLSATGGEG